LDGVPSVRTLRHENKINFGFTAQDLPYSPVTFESAAGERVGLSQDEIKKNAAEADGKNIGESILKTKRPCFVPSYLLSKCMSIVPKIDEISFFLKQHDIKIAMFSETWLRSSIPHAPIEIKDFRLFRRDYKIRAHGGVNRI
jgi:hypothetical protein